MKLRTHYTSGDSNASIFGVLVYKHTTGHSTCLIFSCKRNAVTTVTSTLLHVTIEQSVWNFTPFVLKLYTEIETCSESGGIKDCSIVSSSVAFRLQKFDSMFLLFVECFIILSH